MVNGKKDLMTAQNYLLCWLVVGGVSNIVDNSTLTSKSFMKIVLICFKQIEQIIIYLQLYDNGSVISPPSMSIEGKAREW